MVPVILMIPGVFMVPAIFLVPGIFMISGILTLFIPPVILGAFHFQIIGFILLVLCRLSAPAVSCFILGFKVCLFFWFVFWFGFWFVFWFGFNIRGDNGLLIQDLIDQVLFFSCFNPFDF